MRIRVGHRDYAIEFNGFGDLEDGDTWGDCNKRTGIIRIATHGRPKDVQAETLLHEVFHALAYDCGVEWDEEERMVTLLSLRMAAFFRDNPEFIDEIQAMLAPQDDEGQLP